MNNTDLVQVSMPLQAAYRYPGAGAGGAERVRTRPGLFTLQTWCRPPAAGPLRACIFWRTGVETLTGGGRIGRGAPLKAPAPKGLKQFIAQ